MERAGLKGKPFSIKAEDVAVVDFRQVPETFTIGGGGVGLRPEIIVQYHSKGEVISSANIESLVDFIANTINPDGFVTGTGSIAISLIKTRIYDCIIDYFSTTKQE